MNLNCCYEYDLLVPFSCLLQHVKVALPCWELITEAGIEVVLIIRNLGPVRGSDKSGLVLHQQNKIFFL